MRNTLWLCALLLTACATQTSQSTPNVSLQPYLTNTPANTVTPAVVIADTPLPTSTPITYVVQQGDTISQIAENFHVPQNDIMAANPDVNPNSMSIGTQLLIPGNSGSPAADSTPTPVPVPIAQSVCHPTTDGGTWCFAVIQNTTADFLENVTAQITLLDSNGATITSQVASLPLDIIPPNASMPVYTFFPDAPANVTPQVELLSALQTSATDPRYLPATLHNSTTQISPDGVTAQTSGEIQLPAASKAATKIWVAAVAYDKSGTVIGVKRWEGGALQPGTRLPFNFEVPGLGSKIETVQLFVEARP